VKAYSENYLEHPFQMTKLARENWPKAFITMDPDSYFGFRVTEKPNEEVYQYIWENRIEYLEVWSIIAFNSQQQQASLQRIVENGKEIIMALENELL
jgi:hypothetical protein